MKSAISTLAFSALTLFGSVAYAQSATLVQDIDRPTAQNMVAANCTKTSVTLCSVYTVPAGKNLHLTQVSFKATGKSTTPASISLWGGGALYYEVNNANTSSETDVSAMVDVYVPAGTTISISNYYPLSWAFSIFGTLSDQ